MSSTNAPATNVANEASLEPNDIAKAAVEGKAAPEGQLANLADKLNIKDAASDGDSRAATPVDGEVAAKKKKSSSSKSKSSSLKESKETSGSSNKIQNLASFDPFADADDFDTGKDEVAKTTKAPEYVHIRIQQRNGRKTLTTVQGVPEEYDPKKLLKFFKKEYACNGTLVDDEEGQVIQLQGDQRSKISQTLIEDVGLPRESIKIHGF